MRDATAGFIRESKPTRKDGYFYLNTYCITPDQYEPNDSLAAATVINAVGANITSFTATIDHPGDSDWFSFPYKTVNIVLRVLNDVSVANADDFTGEIL